MNFNSVQKFEQLCLENKRENLRLSDALTMDEGKLQTIGTEANLILPSMTCFTVLSYKMRLVNLDTKAKGSHTI